MEDWLVPIVAIVISMVVLPGMIFHYITIWRKQKTMLPDDERMMEDLWRSAKAMERRIETLEALLDAHEDPERDSPPPRRPRPSYEE